MAAMVPFFISLLNEENNPIMVHIPQREKDVDLNDELKYNIFSNVALDYFENSFAEYAPIEKASGIKLLFQLEGVTVLGTMVKQTGMKIIVGISDQILVNENIREIENVFKTVREVYLKVKMNPFIDVDADRNVGDSRLKESLEQKLSKEFSYKNE